MPGCSTGHIPNCCPPWIVVKYVQPCPSPASYFPLSRSIAILPGALVPKSNQPATKRWSYHAAQKRLGLLVKIGTWSHRRGHRALGSVMLMSASVLFQ